jgi:hypothetical protein
LNLDRSLFPVFSLFPFLSLFPQRLHNLAPRLSCFITHADRPSRVAKEIHFFLNAKQVDLILRPSSFSSWAQKFQLQMSQAPVDQGKAEEIKDEEKKASVVVSTKR